MKHSDNVLISLTSSILRGLSLGIVEVSRDSDDRVLDVSAQVSLCRLLHLDQHHRADLLRGEGLVLVPVLHLQLGPPSLAHHLERPVLLITLN